jgi:hypothetical protein
MKKTGVLRCSLLSLLFPALSFLVAPTCSAQVRVVHQRLPGFPFVSFSFRLTGIDSVTAKNNIEWVFFNRTDSTISFTYRLASMPGDAVMGRITLSPGEQSFAGWSFRGDAIRSVDCTDAEFTPAR